MTLSIIIPNHNSDKLNLVKEAISLLPINCQIIIADDPDGDGKGAAIREGLKIAVGDTIVFLDADMEIHPKMIMRLLPFLEDYDIVVGTKRVDKNLISRKILTYLSRIYIRLLFGLKVDTQTGIKLFKRYAIPEWKTDGFAFDIEILTKAKKAGYTMVEVPIDAVITKRMLWKAILDTLRETIKIYANTLFT